MLSSETSTTSQENALELSNEDVQMLAKTMGVEVAQDRIERFALRYENALKLADALDELTLGDIDLATSFHPCSQEPEGSGT